MASGYTANYGLCQWQPEDQFVREEFNQDNAKIDEALGGKIGRCEPIELPLLSQTSTDRIFDLSGVDWSQWEYVLIAFDIDSPYVSDAGHIRGTLNPEEGRVNSHCTNQGSHFIYGPIGPFLLTFLPLHDPSRQAMGMCSGISGLGICTHTFGELTSICINYDRNGGGMPSYTLAAFGIR